jgi:hypothetical protein
VYPVVIDDWQFQCCGEAFARGDAVGWTLELLDAGGGFYPEDWRVALDGELIDVEGDASPEFRGSARGADSYGDASRLAKLAVRSGGLVVALPGSSALPVSGVLHEEHHGGLPEGMPTTRGIVEQIFVTTQTYAVQDRTWKPIPKAIEASPVDRTPTTFQRETSSGPVRKAEDGLLVFLRVD